MSNAHLAAARPRTGISLLALVVTAALTACGTTTTETPRPSATTPAATASMTPAPTPTPSPTPLPTPTYTNPADPALTRLIPKRLGSVQVEVPPPDQFAMTPGDIGQVYGEIGLRFTELQVAYVPRPQSLSLYVMRTSEPSATTADLEPYLGTAGQYVGISQPERKPWKLKRIHGRLAWVRPEDNATAAGTMVYTWATDGYVFLLIGVDDRLNRQMFDALPAEDAPKATPRPTATPGASGSSDASGSADASASPSGS